MIDWHSHVLPSMDDGSRDVEESVSMLKKLREQGVNCVIATPHFYANDESVDSFLERREKSYSMLKEKDTGDLAEILLGAEIRYYAGIGRMEGLEKLAIGSTRYVLIEMPMTKWTEYTVKELVDISSACGVTVILAHVERYLSLQKADVWRRLRDSGILMQVNASAFNGLLKKRKAIKLIGDGMLHFVGSDCHNMMSRPPNISGAYDAIRKKFGDELVRRINEYGHSIIEKNNILNT